MIEHWCCQYVHFPLTRVKLTMCRINVYGTIDLQTKICPKMWAYLGVKTGLFITEVGTNLGLQIISAYTNIGP